MEQLRKDVDLVRTLELEIKQEISELRGALLEMRHEMTALIADHSTNALSPFLEKIEIGVGQMVVLIGTLVEQNR